MSGVVLRSGEEIAADFVVLAVPFDRVLGLIPESIRDRLPALARLDVAAQPRSRESISGSTGRSARSTTWSLPAG